jgi:predicted 2-oxoglutarate/Fe(II)-dependent dioxygenase YbiX
MEIYNVEDPKLGIILYRDAIPEDINIPERLETVLKDSKHDYFKWNEAMVGHNTSMPEYRDCSDLKVGPAHWNHLPEELSDIKNIYDDYNLVLRKCLTDYEARYNFKMEFMESINFVKYNPGQHFNVHTDSGFSYFCTLSSVGWFNDDYDGGELWFPYLNLTFKPQKGDVLFFPSTYIYAHGSKEVTKGIKYSAVTMFNYNEIGQAKAPISEIEIPSLPVLSKAD